MFERGPALRYVGVGPGVDDVRTAQISVYGRDGERTEIFRSDGAAIHLSSSMTWIVGGVEQRELEGDGVDQPSGRHIVLSRSVPAGHTGRHFIFLKKRWVTWSTPAVSYVLSADMFLPFGGAPVAAPRIAEIVVGPSALGDGAVQTFYLEAGAPFVLSGRQYQLESFDAADSVIRLRCTKRGDVFSLKVGEM